MSYALSIFLAASVTAASPHTLVISDKGSITRIDYRTEAGCIKARNKVREQVAPPPNSNGIIYGQPSIRAFCVPR